MLRPSSINNKLAKWLKPRKIIRAEFHISHDASLQTILSTEVHHVTSSFHHGHARGDVLASSGVPRLEPFLPPLHRFELPV